MIQKILLFIGMFYLTSSQQLYTKVINTYDAAAACLDGTPPILYVHPGTQTNKFLIYFMGGEICQGIVLQQTLSSCYDKIKTTMGSSNGWPDYFQGQGILSTNPSLNDMASWNKIVLVSCDASLHQGFRGSPVAYKNQKLYFRGAANTRAHLQWIMNQFPNFVVANQVIVSGSATGGIASFLWGNYIRDLLIDPTGLMIIPDSSVLMVTKTYLTSVDYVQNIYINLFKLANSDQKTPLELCNTKYPNQQYLCFFFQYAYVNFKARTLVINSEYDSWVIQKALQVPCLTNGNSEYTLGTCSPAQLQFIEQYRNQTRNLLTYYELLSNNSAWTIGCSQHGYINVARYFDSQSEKVPARTGMTIRQAIRSFVQGTKVRVSQTTSWPGNIGCAR